MNSAKDSRLLGHQLTPEKVSLSSEKPSLKKYGNIEFLGDRIDDSFFLAGRNATHLTTHYLFFSFVVLFFYHYFIYPCFLAGFYG